jgi:hypothetical protein
VATSSDIDTPTETPSPSTPSDGQGGYISDDGLGIISPSDAPSPTPTPVLFGVDTVVMGQQGAVGAHIGLVRRHMTRFDCSVHSLLARRLAIGGV